MSAAAEALAALDGRQILQVRYLDEGAEQSYWCSLFAPVDGALYLIEEIGERSDLLAALHDRRVVVVGGDVAIAGTAREIVDVETCARVRNAVAEKFVGEQAFQDLGVVAVVLAVDPDEIGSAGTEGLELSS